MWTTSRSFQCQYICRPFHAFHWNCNYLNKLVSFLVKTTPINAASQHLDYQHHAVEPNFLDHVELYPNFISNREQEALVTEVTPELCLRRYQNHHWDQVAVGYREIEKKQWSDSSLKIFDKVKQLNPKVEDWLEYVHVLDLKSDGEIGYHVDNTEAFGGTLTGISLLSDAVMTKVERWFSRSDSKPSVWK
eukprot:TRINITY_DN1852_c0_g1_i6.p1 TRINITY_DN1852_c0_g1~~TRINITY_DN1852_c0_g1_i6.p1  ORF type:complete len:190 (+),score=14.97 TRINITY_DN1852_c0_g1_i6:61-630(+)